MNKTHLGYLLTMVSALAFASMSLFIKMGYDAGMSAWSFSLIQSSFALTLLLVLLRRERRASTFQGARPAIALFLISGATSAISFNLALVHLSMSLATILLFTYPVFTALGAWAMLGQRPSRYQSAALLLTLTGAVLTANLVEIRSGDISLPGLGLALLAAVAHGIYMVTGERISGRLTATAATTLTRIAILSGSILLNPRVFAEIPHVSAAGWLISLVAAVVSGVAPFLFLNQGIGLIGANRAAIVSVAELPFALGLGLLFQGDVIHPTQLVGALLIVAAVVVSQRDTKEEESPDGSGTSTARSL
ncbi:MAG TPA: DMT family transporter [Symbiobacteriaceae bacterium]|nr:DMT family transporter [Symbiobacteriaceae bacterium]